MPGGRPPKPTALKRLAGNPGKRKLNGEEPIFPRGDMPCPQFLTANARQEWKRMVPKLRDQGMLQSVDGAALAGYCQSRARWISAEKTIDEEGQTIKVPILSKVGEVVGHRVVRHPATLIAKDERLAMKAFAALFGFDPTNRSKLHVEKPKQKNALEAILDGDEEYATIN